MAPTEQDGIRMEGRFDIKQAGALGAVKFMTAERDQVGIELVNILKRFLAKPLHGVGMEYDSMVAANPAKLGNGLNGPDLIIGGHDRD